jgi:phosphonate transport system substrate-binding protein
MSDSTASLPPAADPQSNLLVRRIARIVLYGALLGVLAMVVVAAMRASQADNDLKKRQDSLVSDFGITAPAPKHLSSKFTDKDLRLLADPPSDPKLLLNPDTLVVARWQDADVETTSVDWDRFKKFLGDATGKKVELREYQNTPGDLSAIEEGKAQVVALHAADTPYLVNNLGFIPIAVLGSDAGALGNHLDLAVSTKSKVENLADIRGRTLVSSTPFSITGHRAAIAVLLQQAGMRPNVDYYIVYSNSQKRSVLGVASGEYEIAALSDDKVQSLRKKGSIKEGDFRVIYHSEVIPRLTIGYVYNLEPRLAEKVAKAILDFQNDKADPNEATGKPMRFFKIDYRHDFEFVRKIDDSFDPRFGAKIPKAPDAADSAKDSSEPSRQEKSGADKAGSPKG